MSSAKYRLISETVGIVIVLAVALVAALVLFFDTNIKIGTWELNPRQDVFTADQPAHLVRQAAAERAIVLIQKNANGAFYTACSEPPPDTSQDVARSLSTSLSGLAGDSGEMTAQSAAQLSADIKSATEVLFRRSQGIQLLRDTMFRLCEAFQNGVIRSEDYRAMILNLISTANFVIPLEQCMGITGNANLTDLKPDLVVAAINECLTSARDFNQMMIQIRAVEQGIRPDFLSPSR